MVTEAISGLSMLSTCGPCALTDSPEVPCPLSLEILPVSANSTASTMPLFPVPFGPQAAKLSPFSSRVWSRMPRNSRILILSMRIMLRHRTERFV